MKKSRDNFGAKLLFAIFQSIDMQNRARFTKTQWLAASTKLQWKIKKKLIVHLAVIRHKSSLCTSQEEFESKNWKLLIKQQ